MFDLIVVGGGPAGMTAALYAARAGKTVLVLEQESVGGQIVSSPLVENYPGIPGLSGARFAEQLAAQLEDLNVEICAEQVMEVQREENGFRLISDMDEYSCTALVLATGVRHRALGLPGEEELVGAGVSYCAVCDGAFYKDQTVAIVGGGDTALQDALFLANRCEKVILIHRRDQFRGEQRLVERVKARENVELLLSHTVEALEQADGSLTGLTVHDLTGERTRSIPVNGVFLAVGQQPQSEIFAGLVPMDEKGYFLAGEDTCTGVSGIFAAGDCRKKTVRQLTTAVGDGAVAGLAACAYVDEQEGE